MQHTKEEQQESEQAPLDQNFGSRERGIAYVVGNHFREWLSSTLVLPQLVCVKESFLIWKSSDGGENFRAKNLIKVSQL